MFTAEDLSDLVKPMVATSRMPNYYATPILPLARGKVRYVGEPVVGVVADTAIRPRTHSNASPSITSRCRSIIDPEQAVRPGAPLLHEEAGTNVLVEPRVQARRRRCRLANRRRSASEPLPHAPQDRGRDGAARVPRRIRAGRDALTLHSATQVPGIVRDALALAFGIPAARIRVVAPDVGGGFGGKGSLYPEEIFVCAAARRLRRPVKWTSDRLEDLTASSQAFDEIVDAELALDGDGRILGLRADVIGDVGAYSIYPWTAALEPVQVVSFLPGSLSGAELSRPRAGGGDLESADRPLSRRRPADLDLRHGAADRHGGGENRHRRQGNPAAQSRRQPPSFPTKSPPASSGTNPAFRNA